MGRTTARKLSRISDYGIIDPNMLVGAVVSGKLKI